MDEYKPSHSEALERFLRGEIDAQTYAKLTDRGLVEVLTEQATAVREAEERRKRAEDLLSGR